jgi:hypothetical protein
VFAARTRVEPIEPDQPAPLPSSNDQAISALTGIAAPAVSARPHATQLTMMLVGAAGVLAGVACVLAFAWLRGDAPIRTAAAAAPAASAATKPAAAVIESGPAPTWNGARTASWAHDGSKTISFELNASREVPVWMSKVRPVLVVRCLSRATQAFVVIGTSASFEEDSFRRTIRLQWDDGPETTQQWQTSESGQELFAPDGVAFARELTHGRRLRFGFTPFNAQPVTAEFVVEGFEPLAGLVATTCGWRL